MYSKSVINEHLTAVTEQVVNMFTANPQQKCYQVISSDNLYGIMWVHADGWPTTCVFHNSSSRRMPVDLAALNEAECQLIMGLLYDATILIRNAMGIVPAQRPSPAARPS